MSKTNAKLTSLLALQEKISDDIKAVQALAAKEIGDIAVKAGLHTLDLSPKQLLEAFQEVAARFSKETNKD